jgi:hypothetical protein
MNNPVAALEAPSVHDFEAWLATGKPGEVYVYATRHVLDNKTPPETQVLASLAREAFGRGQVELAQKRTSPGGPFEYRAIKRRVQRVPTANGLKWLPRIPKTWETPYR